jgi:hypothetical protein
MTIPPNTRTNLPKLAMLLLYLCGYINRHRITILKYLPEGSTAALDAVLVACSALELIVSAELPTD